MSITSVNAIWYGNSGTSVSTGPTVSGQTFAQSTLAGSEAKILRGFCLPVLDGSSTTFTVNWINGTATLLYPPDFVEAFTFHAPAWQASVSGGDAGENVSLGPPYTTPFINYYPTNYIVTAAVSATNYVFQATTGGAAGSATPTWATSGNVTDGSVIWKNIGQDAATTQYVDSVSAVTSTSATITISGAGTSTYALPIGFTLLLHG